MPGPWEPISPMELFPPPATSFLAWWKPAMYPAIAAEQVPGSPIKEDWFPLIAASIKLNPGFGAATGGLSPMRPFPKFGGPAGREERCPKLARLAGGSFFLFLFFFFFFLLEARRPSSAVELVFSSSSAWKASKFAFKYDRKIILGILHLLSQE